MFKRLNPVNITEDQLFNRDLANWIIDSHNWIEHSVGYYECAWCRRALTSTMGININFPLCEENPIIKKEIEKNYGRINEINN